MFRVKTDVSSMVEGVSDLKQRVRFLENKIKTLNQKVRRKEKLISNLQDLLKDLKSKGLVQSETAAVLKSHFGGVMADIFNNKLANRFQNP